LDALGYGGKALRAFCHSLFLKERLTRITMSSSIAAHTTCRNRMALAALGACWAVLVTHPTACAWHDPTSYVQPPLPWHQISTEQSPIQLPSAVPIVAAFVNDGWTSRYQAEIAIAGGLVHYEKPRYPYAADTSLKLAFYQVYGHDTVLAEHGIEAGIEDAHLATLNGRPTAYLAWQGSDATCFAFVSQFAKAPEHSRDRMLNGSVCHRKGEIDADTLTREWLALIEQLVVR